MKEFLSQHRVKFAERNIAGDENALAELVARGYQTTPVTFIDSVAIIGFDAAKISALLGL